MGDNMRIRRHLVIAGLLGLAASFGSELVPDVRPVIGFEPIKSLAHRVGLYRPVHVKTLRSQKLRMRRRDAACAGGLCQTLAGLD